MRKYAKVSPQFWTGETSKKISDLGLEARILAFYLLTSPHSSMIGIYYLPIAYIAQDTALPFEGASKALQSLCEVGFCSYDTEAEYVWIHNMAFYQIDFSLEPNDNRVKGIQKLYEKLPKLLFLSAFFEKYQAVFHLKNIDEKQNNLQVPSKPLQSQEQEQEHIQKQKTFMSSKKLRNVHFHHEKNTKNNNPASQNKNHHSVSDVDLKKQATEILNFLNQRTRRQYRPVDTNLKLIIARLQSGATPLQCRQIIIRKHREWKDDPKMIAYLRPATLFNATKFEQYLGELVAQYEEESK